MRIQLGIWLTRSSYTTTNPTYVLYRLCAFRWPCPPCTYKLFDCLCSFHFHTIFTSGIIIDRPEVFSVLFVFGGTSCMNVTDIFNFGLFNGQQPNHRFAIDVRVCMCIRQKQLPALVIRRTDRDRALARQSDGKYGKKREIEKERTVLFA